MLEHDGFVLYETQAIVRYLDRVLPKPALTPADAKCAARMDQVMNVNDWYLFQGVNNVITFQRIVVPRLLGAAPDEAAIASERSILQWGIRPSEVDTRGSRCPALAAIKQSAPARLAAAGEILRDSMAQPPALGLQILSAQLGAAFWRWLHR